jgi:hypothetical protein
VIAGKGFDLDDWEAVYRFSCSYFKINTQGWLDKEIEHTRAVRKYRDAYDACKRRSKNPSLKRPVSPVAPE